jgi:hypothetical protein
MTSQAATQDLEVAFRSDTGKAVIEGKTMVPFQSFVTLVLQRKVLQLTKTWGREPIILSSELLTSLASAPQDSQENRSSLILVSLCIGILAGVMLFALTQVGLSTVDITLTNQELLIVAGVIIAIGFILALMMKVQRKPKSVKLIETIEGISSFLTK